MIAELDSPDIETRRKALQTLVDFHDAPVGSIRCWPWNQCTYLQMRSMESLMGRWLEVVNEKPSQSEEAVVEAMFTFGLNEDLQAVPAESPAPSQQPGLVEKNLDRLGEIVKDAVLDWNASTFATDDPAPDEDAPLGPMQREPFIAAMREKVTETIEQIADLVGAAPTARALAGNEPRVGEMLADLRGEALALALEMRGVQTTAAEPVVRPQTDAPDRSIPRWLRPDAPWPTAPDFPGGWVKKYRRIRRAGV
jgi:hypothetical protein